MIKKNEEDLLNEFILLKEQLNKWGEIVDKTIMEVLNDPWNKEHLIKIPPSYRLKDEKSFLSKAFYRKKNYTDPISNIEDKIGTRIVMIKTSDVYEVKEALLNFKGWRSLLTKDILDGISESPKEFDYQSVHIVVRPNNDSSEFKSQDLDKLSCEIQIRTLLQHAFAEISHDSTYKGPYKNDNDIIRKLSKSMALMEATDDYFCDIFKMMTDEERRFKNFTNELIKFYQIFAPTFDKKELDIELTDLIFEFLTTKEGENILVSDLETFCEKEKIKLSDNISKKRLYIFGQPVIILVAYLIFNKPNFLIENWSLELEILKDLYLEFGVSFD